MNIPKNKFYGLFVPFCAAGEVARGIALQGKCLELRREEGAAGHRLWRK
ncbi:hypothetical protein RLEG12_30875 [Rhizobium leguminosarum bv. trifolii CB782]|nr:hypothetical protein RLEG12_30875 [Rhizobium leguminosarum bv. trifolii CB782]